MFIRVHSWSGELTPHFGVTRHRVEGGHPCNVISLPAVQKAEPENIGAKESPARPEGKIEDRSAAAPPQGIAQKIFAVSGDFWDLVVNSRGVVMQQIAL